MRRGKERVQSRCGGTKPRCCRLWGEGRLYKGVERLCGHINSKQGVVKVEAVRGREGGSRRVQSIKAAGCMDGDAEGRSGIPLFSRLQNEISTLIPLNKLWGSEPDLPRQHCQTQANPKIWGGTAFQFVQACGGSVRLYKNYSSANIHHLMAEHFVGVPPNLKTHSSALSFQLL